MELPAGKSKFDAAEVRFKNGRKGFYRVPNQLPVAVGDSIVVEGSPGYDIGVITLTGELVKTQMSRKKVHLKTHELKKVLRKPSEEDLEKWKKARANEYEHMHEARKLALDLGLQMKISDVEYQGDGGKATFYYTAETRVDFRELIKRMADVFKVRIEMKQIGARQEAGRLGGIGSCGRELCCTTWLTDFRSVATSSARYQQLSLNPQKLAGQCGKLKCCLNYELDMYIEAYKEFPSTNVKLRTKKGNASHQKTDIFKKMMWYFMPDSERGGGKIVPLKVDRVREIIAMNKQGDYPNDLTEFQVFEAPKVEPAYENVVGQDDLTRFDEKFKKRRKNKRKPRNKQGGHQQKQQTTGKNQNKKQGQQKKQGQNRNQQPKNKQGANNNKSKGGNPKRSQARKSGNKSNTQNKPNKSE